MSNEFEPSSELAELFFLAIDEALAGIDDGSRRLAPFAVTVGTNGKKGLNRFDASEPEDGLKQAREYVALHRNALRMYAIAWDGFTTRNGKCTDAILVEAGDRAAPFGVLFCQSYRRGKRRLYRRAKCERVGSPGLIDRPCNRLEGDHVELGKR